MSAREEDRFEVAVYYRGRNRIERKVLTSDGKVVAEGRSASVAEAQSEGNAKLRVCRKSKAASSARRGRQMRSSPKVIFAGASS
jgi:hypothetical protein